MAGTILIVGKGANPKFSIQNIIAKCNDYLFSYFEKYIPNIVTHHQDEKSLLIEFRKDTRTKYSVDKNGNWLTYEGEIFSLDETRLLSANDVLDIYLRNGDSFANRLDGTFVIKLYDKAKSQYKVITDFIKNKTNYFCETDDYFMFTSFLLSSALIQKPVLDKYAFNEYLWRYYILSKRSILSKVVRLSPATIYLIDSNKISENSYWEWPREYTNLSFTDSVDKTIASMQETARLIDQSYGKPCIDFTMGQDSRQVVAAFRNQKISFTTATFGKPDFYEVENVHRISIAHGFENHNVQLKQDYYDNLGTIFQEAITLGSCEQPGYMLGRILYLKKQYANWANVSLNGVDGHFYKNGLWDEQYLLNLYRQPKNFNIDLFLRLRALSKNYRSDIFTDSIIGIKNESNKYFTEIIKESIRDYASSPVSLQIDKFDLTHWLNFAIAANNATNTIIAHISPLLLRRNLEFALRVPVNWKFNLSKYQRAVVFSLDPDLAREKTDFAGVNMVPKNFLTFLPFYGRYFYFQSNRFRKKIKTKLGFKVASHLHEAWDYQTVYSGLLNLPQIKNLLGFDEMLLADNLIKDKWNELVNFDSDQENSIDRSEYILKLASVEYFLRIANKIWAGK